MRNNKFWDECNDGSIRKAVAEFIDSTPTILNRLKEEEYYAVEDAIVEFIEANKEKIYREVDKEYRRDDIEGIVSNIHNGRAVLKLSLPLEVIDKFVQQYEDNIGNSDNYFQEMIACAEDAIFYSGYNIFKGVEELTKEELVLYIAYLKDWFSCHDFPHEMPACPDEFFECEMNDEECREYYEGLAAELDRLEE